MQSSTPPAPGFERFLLHQIESEPRYLDPIQNRGRIKRQHMIDLSVREASCTGNFFTFFFLILVIKGFTPDIGYGQDKIRIGVPLFPTVSYPVFIAQEKGFFEKNGLKAEIIRINSEPTTYQALISGDIDATSGAPTGLVQSNLQGVPVVSLGSWDNLVSYTVATREKIDDLSQLKGKKIGIN